MITIEKKLKGYEYIRTNQKAFFPKAYSLLDDEIALMLGIFLSKELHENIVFRNFPEMESSLIFWKNYFNGDTGTACLKHKDPYDYMVGDIYTENVTNRDLDRFFYREDDDGISSLSFSYGIESLLSYCILNELDFQFKPANLIWECPDSYVYIQLLKGALNLRYLLPVETFYLNNNFLAKFFMDDFLIQDETHSTPFVLPQFIMRLVSNNTSNVIVGCEKMCNCSALYRGLIYYYSYDTSSLKLNEFSNFLQKTYGTNVFSILYPISKTAELKILYNRYESKIIKRIHVSCHNTAYGIQNCGFCEKCGRVYAMMKSLGIDTKGMFNLNPFDHLEAFPYLKSAIGNKKSLSNLYIPGCDPLLELSEDGSITDYYFLREADLALARCVELGIRSPVTDIFKKEIYPYIENRIDDMEREYAMFDSNYFNTIPVDIRRDITDIFAEHLDKK